MYPRSAIAATVFAIALSLLLPSGGDAFDAHELMPEIHGYVAPRLSVIANTGFNPEDQDGFDVYAARLRILDDFAFTAVTGAIDYELEIEFAGGSPTPFNLFVGWNVWPEFGFRMGQFKVPFGFANLSSTSKQMFADPVRSKSLTYARDRGVQVHGVVDLVDLVDDRPLTLRYAAGVFNGEGIGVARNLNEKFLYAGRLLLEAFGSVGDDESDLDPCNGKWREECTSARPLRLAVGGAVVYDPAIGKGLSPKDNGRDETRYAIEAHMKIEGLALNGEVVRGNVGGIAGSPSFARLGYWAAVGYNPTWVNWLEPTLRYEFYDVDDSEDNAARNAGLIDFQSRRLITAGINAYAFKHKAKLQINYVLTDLQEGVKKSPESKVLYGDKVIAQIQVGF